MNNLMYDLLINDNVYYAGKIIIFGFAIILVVIVIINATNIVDNNHKYPVEKLKSLKKLSITLGCISLILFSGLMLSPSRDFIVYHYGDPREAIRKELKDQFEKDRENRERRFLECLDKGQKQPHTTTFNDTNEVVKTCYDISTKL